MDGTFEKIKGLKGIHFFFFHYLVFSFIHLKNLQQMFWFFSQIITKPTPLLFPSNRGLFVRILEPHLYFWFPSTPKIHIRPIPHHSTLPLDSHSSQQYPIHPTLLHRHDFSERENFFPAWFHPCKVYGLISDKWYYNQCDRQLRDVIYGR